MKKPTESLVKLDVLEKGRQGPTVGKIKKVNEFLWDAVQSFQKTDFPTAIGEALPWVGLVGHALAEVVGPVKFVVKLYENATRIPDPNELAYLACTLAYQRAVEQSIIVLPISHPLRPLSDAERQRLKALAFPDDLDFARFTFANALEHPFITAADAMLTQYVESIGYQPAESRALLSQVHLRFLGIFKTLLAHGDTRERFAPLTEAIRLGSGERQAAEALLEHADYQRWLFEEKPVFGKEPFALKHVYIDTECGELTWGLIRDGERGEGDVEEGKRRRLDPFHETRAKRVPLLDTVLDKIGDPGFGDAIVVQGVAGAGKSSFTLRLCAELLRQGLRPIRVLLRDLRFDRPVEEALAQAIRLGEEAYSPTVFGNSRPDDLFAGGVIFKEHIRFGTAEICPYVLILDGWDEINVSVSEGLNLRVDRMLEQLRNTYLRRGGPPIRIILTGRPSTAVTGSSFLQEKTPILTIRPLNPEQLLGYVTNIRAVLEDPPFAVAPNSGWPPPDLDRFQAVFARYRQDFDRLAVCRRDGISPRP